MSQVGIRELRQDASALVRRVKGGESIEITVRGEVVAILVPPREEATLARLEAEGRFLPGRGVLAALGPPLPPAPGEPLPSAALEVAREGER